MWLLIYKEFNKCVNLLGQSIYLYQSEQQQDVWLQNQNIINVFT